MLRKAATYFVTCILSTAIATTASANCTSGSPVPIRGKIYNNLQPSGAFNTLGVVHLILAANNKMNCGFVGEPASPSIPPQFGGIAFTHTVSCDDIVDVFIPPFGNLMAHSQLTLDTDGTVSVQFCNGVDATNGVFGSFEETSTPKTIMGNSTGRGLFTGVTEGEITIKGTLNCIGSVDMKFSGYLCLQQP